MEAIECTTSTILSNSVVKVEKKHCMFGTYMFMYIDQSHDNHRIMEWSHINTS